MKDFWLIILLLMQVQSSGQQPYRLYDNIKATNIPVVLNHSSLPASLQQLYGDITILDFFGTWCVPCIKALPHL